MDKTLKQKRVDRVRELQKEYKDLARTANRRMRNLERMAEKPEYKSVLGYAYRNAMEDLKGLGELTKGNRFSTDITRMSAEETDIRHLTALISTAKSFLESPSSTKTGIDKVYSRRAETINRKYNSNLSTDDLKTFFETTYWKKLSNNLGSQTAMIIIGKIQEKSENIVSEVEEARSRHKRINFTDLQDVDGLNVNNKLGSKDKSIIYNLAKIYSNQK